MAGEELWYFGYGSNMNRSVFLERRRMRPLETRTGYLDDYRLCFNLPVGRGERGVANLEPGAGARTHGVLYRLSAEQADHLDRTEGVPSGVYRRISVSVVAGAVRVGAFTYLSRHTRTRTRRKPSARYLGLLLEGARQHGLPDDYVRALEGLERAVDERIGEAGAER